MLSRYRKIKEDSRYSAAEDRGQYFATSITYVFYLLLSPSNSLYLHGKRSLRKLNKKNIKKVVRILVLATFFVTSQFKMI